MKFTLEKPDLTKIDLKKIISELRSPLEYDEFVKKYLTSEYIYWDKFKYKKPLPKILSKEDVWYYIKMLRKFRFTKTIIKDEKDHFFSWSKLDYFEEVLHGWT